ncbi:hypothetical protein DIS24_g9393 [Lasiodiplodia hormozganensis]|uniref:RNase H type-1 domain-containing protein n=1 Tax=Lasiodiplodia hormozganensis TaxID=869390 RepID=A0AA39XUE7_9PEZI|nr:hypothetical protein DIS24_g9393 [Lasiodiplodia hormozganensis]
MAEASRSSPLSGARDPPDSSSSAPAPSTPIPDNTEEPPVPASKARRRRGKKKKKNARSSSARSTGRDTENPTASQATQLADASSSLGVEAQEEQEEEQEPPAAPPPSPISHGQWSPPLPPLGKLQGKVVIEPNKAIAAQFAKTYSDRRSDTASAASILPIFTDGSASYIINDATKDRFCSASTVFRAHPSSDAWIERGYPLLLATDSLNAEVFGLGRGLRDGRDYVRAHPEMGIRTLLVFTDVMKFLEMLPRIEAGEWDVVKRGYVEEFLALDAELAGDRMGVRVEYHWVPGHSGVEGNDRADRASRRCRPDVKYPHVFRTLPYPSREEQLLNQQAKLERKRKHEEDVSRAVSKRSRKRAREEEET